MNEKYLPKISSYTQKIKLNLNLNLNENEEIIYMHNFKDKAIILFTSELRIICVEPDGEEFRQYEISTEQLE